VLLPAHVESDFVVPGAVQPRSASFQMVLMFLILQWSCERDSTSHPHGKRKVTELELPVLYFLNEPVEGEIPSHIACNLARRSGWFDVQIYEFG
jgi:hypothetical protein